MASVNGGTSSKTQTKCINRPYHIQVHRKRNQFKGHTPWFDQHISWALFFFCLVCSRIVRIILIPFAPHVRNSIALINLLLHFYAKRTNLDIFHHLRFDNDYNCTRKYHLVLYALTSHYQRTLDHTKLEFMRPRIKMYCERKCRRHEFNEFACQPETILRQFHHASHPSSRVCV